MTDTEASEFWESRYSEREQIWSGKPNHALVAEVADVAPGRALDLGCGEGGDSVWLADQGWQVTAVDVSSTAVARARALASSRAIADGRITWIEADLASWRPTETYELVSACFLHSPLDFPRKEVLTRAAGAVARGGHLLVVAHAEPPPWARDDHAHHCFDPAQEIADLRLGPADWDVAVSDVRSREATGPDGEHATLRDSIVFARRR